MGEERNFYDGADTAEEASLIKRSRAHQQLGEWAVGEAGWLPPDDFLGGEQAELPTPDLPPHLGGTALRMAGRQIDEQGLARALNGLERINDRSYAGL